jgi:hypothetical protein
VHQPGKRKQSGSAADISDDEQEVKKITKQASPLNATFMDQSKTTSPVKRLG